MREAAGDAGCRARARVVPAIAAHVAEFAPRIRASDRREIEAAFARPPEEILATGYRNARRCWTVLAGGRPIAMFGVGRRRAPRIGTAWLLASEELGRFRGQLRREGPYWAELLMAGHDVLTNFVLADNRVAIRWLTWLGFELIALRREMGTGGEDFWEFAAFRPGVRERYLPPPARAPGAAAMTAPAASMSGAPRPRDAD